MKFLLKCKVNSLIYKSILLAIFSGIENIYKNRDTMVNAEILKEHAAKYKINKDTAGEYHKQLALSCIFSSEKNLNTKLKFFR